MRIINVVLFAFASMNINGCKDTPESLGKKVTELEAELAKHKMSSSTTKKLISEMKEYLTLPQGETALKPSAVQEVKARIKQVEAELKKNKNQTSN
jgi:multidrug resistance efflux pump